MLTSNQYDKYGLYMKLSTRNGLVDTRFRKLIALFYGYSMKCFERERYQSYRRKYKIAERKNAFDSY